MLTISEISQIGESRCAERSTWHHWVSQLQKSIAVPSAVVALLFGQLSYYFLPDYIYLIVFLVTLVVCMPRINFRIIGVSCLVGLLLASDQTQQWHGTLLPDDIESIPIDVVGVVEGLPSLKGSRVDFAFLVDQARLEGNMVWQNFSKPDRSTRRIKLSCYRCDLEFAVNQRWRLTVKLKRPRGYASWGAFDYEQYLFRRQIVATGYVRDQDRARLLSTSIDHSYALSQHVQQWRWNAKERFDSLSKLSDHDYSVGFSILAALTIGDKSSFSTDQRDVFAITGIGHLMAISGLHIGLVFALLAALLGRLLNLFPRLYLLAPRQNLVLLPALLVAILYAALAGFAVPTQRALIMLLLYCLVKWFGLQMSLFRTLCFAMLFIAIIDPLSVLDMGFWLSCSAVAIISILLQRSQRTEPRDTSALTKPSVVSNCLVSIGQLMSMQFALVFGLAPINALMFGQVSAISILVNLVAVPLFSVFLIPLALLLCSVDAIAQNNTWVDLAITQLARLFEVIFSLLEDVASLPLVSLSTQMGVLFALSVYLSFALALRCSKAWLSLIVVLLAISLTRIDIADDEFSVTLLDVGQGLSLVVETGSKVLVYDVGPRFRSGFNTVDAVLLPYLQYRKIRLIDTLVISHADNDHIGGLAILENKIPIKEKFSSRLDKVEDAIYCQRGYQWHWQGVTFEFISPSGETPTGSNNLSCVLRIEHPNGSFLLTGDIESPVERWLLRSHAKLTADFMLIPHQGSKTSSTPEFLDAVSPNVAVVAAGYRNSYGHPHESVIQRYHERDISVYSTIESGSIRIVRRNKQWSVEQLRKQKPRVWRIP